MGARVFISRTDEDIVRCEQLLNVLGEWQVPCYFDTIDRRSGQSLSDESKRALVDCDVMLRVCTKNTNRSYWMSIEVGALLALQADDHRAGQRDRHKIINLLLDKEYVPEPFDINSTVVDATYTLSAVWVNDLRRALDLPPLMDIAPIAERINPPQEKKLGRRAVVGIGAAGALALAGAGVGGYQLWLRNQPVKIKPPSTDARLKWWRQAGDLALLNPGSALITASPVVVGNAVYIVNNQGLTLALTREGATLWQYALPDHTSIVQAPAVADDVVYVSGVHNGIYAIQNGATIWANNRPADGTLELTQLVVAEGKLFVNTGAEGLAPPFVTVADLKTGKALLELSPTATSLLATSRVAVQGNIVYVGAEDGYLYALDMTQPSPGQVWHAKVGDQAQQTFIGGGITVDSGVVYANSLDMNVYALDAVTGAQRWAYTASDTFKGQTPAIGGGLVYAVSWDGVVHAIDSSTGKLRWKNTTVNAYSSPVVADGVVYVGTGHTAVVALDAATGVTKTRYATAANIEASPTIDGSDMYVADAHGYVYVFSLAH